MNLVQQAITHGLLTQRGFIVPINQTKENVLSALKQLKNKNARTIELIKLLEE